MSTQQGPVEVLVTQVIQQDVPVFREWIGNLDGSVNTQIQAKVLGYLISQDYKDGALVKQGEVLFQIDPRPLQAALHQAEGDLARATATQQLESANLRRANQLYARKVTSAQEHDVSVTNFNTSRADVTAQTASVNTAQLNLEYAQITSPVDGIAGIALAQVGDLVGPSSPRTGPLTTVSVVDPIKAYFTVTERDYIAIARREPKGGSPNEFGQGLELELILADGSVYSRKGCFDFADRQVDVTTGSIRVAGLFANPNYFLRPGLFCRVRAQVDSEPDALLVPVRAIMEVQGNFQVAVITPDHKATIRPVELGPVKDGWRVATKGVKLGESVVVEGLQKAREGAPVTPKPWKPPEVPK